jgi:hypothetical protein
LKNKFGLGYRIQISVTPMEVSGIDDDSEKEKLSKEFDPFVLNKNERIAAR